MPNVNNNFIKKECEINLTLKIIKSKVLSKRPDF